MEQRSLSYEEILNHSLPFLSAINNGISRLRILEAGGNPDKENEENGFDNSHESTMSSADFFNQINSAWD